MTTRKLPRLPDPAALREGTLAIYRSHRVRKTLLILAVLLVIFGLLGFFAAPPILKGQLESRLSTTLDRPVTLGAVHLNPYTLKLDLDQLHIGERDRKSPFVDIDRLTVNASWGSLFRFAPVLDELVLQHPQLHITRTAPQQFNFSDLIERLAAKPTDPPSSPTRFAISNISVHNGDIGFDDRVLNASHHVDQFELGIPFIANLPSKTDVFVKPLLAMRVDGSPIHIEGETKPFASTRESAINFKLDHLDLPRYLAYAPVALPIAIPRGQLSGGLALHFVAAESTPQLRLDGQLAVDDFKLVNHDNTPLLELGHGTATLNDVEPLLSRYHFAAIALDRTTLHYTRMAGGHSNFDALTSPATPAANPAKSTAPATTVHIDALTLQDAGFEYADLSGQAPARLTLDHMHGSLHGLSTAAGPAGSMELAAQLAGGTVNSSGKLDLNKSRYDGKVDLKNVALAPLMSLAPPLLNADITGGNLDANGQLQAEWGQTFNLHIEPAQASLNRFALSPRGSHTAPVAWESLNAEIAKFDLASSEARLTHVVLRGSTINLQRLKNGSMDLSSLMATPAKSTPVPRTNRAAGKPATNGGWHWSVADLSVEGSTLTFKDANASKPTPLVVKASKFSVDGLSDDMRQPLKLALTGKLGNGDYDVSGSVKPQPLDADLRLKTRGMDIAPMESMIRVPLNVRIGSALLSLDGRLRYSDHGSEPAHIDYRGQATLGRVKVQDKLTGDDFLRWHSLTATGMVIRLGQGAPHADIGGLALSDFYARVIVNPTGRINLQDVVASPETAPVSVTREQSAPQAAAATAAASAATAAKAAAPEGPKPEIQIGQISVVRGQLNYTDNFIKPNYTANITDLGGKVGAFGTTGGAAPAELVLQGKLDGNSPVDIGGSINPLTPVAFLDIKAKADGVELTHLSPYSGKYAGYPITSGRLTVDVHYQLDQRKLTANNHIFITQLTFGDRIEGPGVSHLPVKLAVALLKDSDGNIDVNVPVSGSLDDPQFSMGSLVWHAVVNLLTRAVTSPFRLLASIGGGSHPDLGYVEFAPGSAVLDAEAQSRLEQLLKLLQSKPSLTLDIIGRIDPSVDESGLRKVMVDDLVRKAKADDNGKKEDPATLTLTPDESEHYLERVYKHADFPKPKNMIGLTKSQPSEEMHQLLETNMPVNAEALQHLAERRAEAVQTWFKGKLDDKRVAMLAPKLDAKGIEDKGKTTRDDFGLH
ncbi:DUF748 domain-containing protein [Dyella tabacisoli]|uniref:DUF748 domain-containing protein n=1 Tax=Dyella tabacisoli TaxID=2282381 RepID=A0A369USJ7_9GAMM|nr:DUF748 domain-containing protein [Dyella tabacisoli]RDD83491.1 DUF748 domain-containing protein [Dyella tabacisoli]